MRRTVQFPTRSGYGVLYDPHLVRSIGEKWDLERLQASAAQGALAFWPSVDDECVVLVLDDPPLTELPHGIEPFSRTTLHARDGHLGLADAAALDHAPRDRGAPEAATRIEVAPGTYAATVWLPDWPAREYDDALRRSVGGSAVAFRDAIAWLAMIVGALTLIGMPVFLLGRALDAGLPGLLNGAILSGAVLIPLWVAIIIGLRLPVIRRTDRADAAVELAHPDAVIHLELRA